MQVSFGGIAQLVEHLHGMQGVSGSNPLTSTKIRLRLHRRPFHGRYRGSNPRGDANFSEQPVTVAFLLSEFPTPNNLIAIPIWRTLFYNLLNC